MTLKNEAIRLFFAVTALILVGMLATPMAEQPGPELSARELTGVKPVTAQRQPMELRNIGKRAQRVVLK